METLCFDQLWNRNLTWDTLYGPRPHFTQCFQDTVLIWVVCGIVWIVAMPIELARLCRRPVTLIPFLRQWSVLSLIKVTLTLMLIVITAVDWIYGLKEKFGTPLEVRDFSATPGNILGNAIKMFTYVRKIITMI